MTWLNPSMAVLHPVVFKRSQPNSLPKIVVPSTE